jgi:hypothetical protein
MPGGYQGYLSDGTFGVFESFDAYYFEFSDANGNPLQIGQNLDDLIIRKIAYEKCKATEGYCSDKFYYDLNLDPKFAISIKVKVN